MGSFGHFINNLADITHTQASSPKHTPQQKKTSLVDFTSSIMAEFMSVPQSKPKTKTIDVMQDPLYLKVKHILKSKTTEAVPTKPRLEYLKYFTYD